MGLFGFRGTRGKRNKRQNPARRRPLLARTLHCEPLEQRHLLSVTVNPIVGPDTGGVYDVPSGKDLYVPLTGTDTGNTITYTATSSDPNVQATVLTGNPELVLTVSGTGKNSIPISGTLTFELFKNIAPQTVAAIEADVASGLYTNSSFYRMEIGTGFQLIQGGIEKTGQTPPANVANEYNAAASFNSPGLLAMAANGSFQANSEFFAMAPNVTLANEPQFLSNNYTVFGQMIGSQTVYNEILNVPTTAQSGIDFANTPVTIKSAQIVTTDTQNAVLQISEPSTYTGNPTITVTGTGSDSTSQQQQFTADIAPTTAATSEQPVVIQPVSNVVTAENQSVSFQVSAKDMSSLTSPNFAFNVTNAGPFGQPSTYTAPTNVTVQVTPGTGTGDTATVKLTPATGFVGTLNLTLHADELNQSFNYRDSLDFTLTVPGPMSVTTPTTTQDVKFGGTLNVSGVSLTDPGLPTADNVTVTLGAQHGTLSLLTTGVTGGITSAQVTGSGTGSVSITAPLAAINATLAATGGLTYTPAGTFTGSDTLSITANDGTTFNNSGGGNITLAVAGPLNVTAPSTMQVVKTGGSMVIGSVSVADTALPTADNVTVTFGAQKGTVTLSTTVSGGITSSEVTGNGTGSVSVTAPLAAINLTLADANGLTYMSNGNSNGSDTLAITANDGAFGNMGTANVSLLVAGPLTFAVPSTQQGVMMGGTLNVSGVSVADPSLPTTDMVTVTLAATNGNVSLSTTVTGGITSGDVTGNDTGSVSVTAPLAAVDATLAATGGLTYAPNGAYVGADTLSLHGSDTLGNIGNASISLAAVGPLTFTTPSGTLDVSAGGTPALSGVSVLDPSLPSTDNVTVGLTAAHGNVTLSTTVSGGLTGAEVTGNGTGSVSITAPLAAVDATLAAATGLTYTPTAGSNGADTLSLTGSDTLGNSGTGSVSLLAIGPLTIATTTTPQVVGVGGTLNVSGVSIADPSLPSGDNVTVTLGAAHGNLTLLTTGVSGGVTSTEITGNGTGSVSINAPLAAINATLAAASGLAYVPNTGFAGTDTLAITANDGSSLNNSNTGSVSLIVVGPLSFTVPSAPVLAPISGSLGVSGVAIVDPSLPTSDVVTMGLAATHGNITLSTTVTGGLSSTEITGNGTGSVTINAPVAAINATLAASGGLAYAPGTGYTGPDTLALTGSDTFSNAGTGKVSLIDVGPLTITAPTTQQILPSNGTPAVSGISLHDPSLPTGSNVTMTLGAGHGTVTLSTSVSGGIIGSQVTGNDTGSVTIIAPLAAINATLADAHGLTYTSTGSFNGTDTLSLVANDAATNSGTVSASVLIVGPMKITTPSATQVLPANGTLVIGGISVADPSLPTSDIVTLTLGAGHGNVTLSTTVSGGIGSGDVTGNGTGSLTITATVAAIDATLADASGLTYAPANNFNGTDTLSLSAGDTIGNNGTGSVAIAVGLTVSVPSAMQTVGAAGAAIAGISVTDPALTTGTVTLTLGVGHGTLNVSTAVSGGLGTSQVTNNGTASVTVTGSVAAIDATLAATSGLTYTPANNYNGADTLSLSATDTLGSTHSASVSLLAVGPMTITAPTTQQDVKAGGTLGISGMSLADPSLPTTDNVTLTLAAGHGTVTLLTTGVTGGITSTEVTGNGTGSVSITAPVAAIDATLAAVSGLTYTPASTYNGADTLSLASNDTLGNSATGSVSLLAVGPLTITAPTTQQVLKAGGTLVVGGIAVADPSLPTGDNVTLTLSAPHGALTLSTSVTGGISSSQVTNNGTGGVTINAPLTTINATLADAGGLTYAPASGFNGTDTLSLTGGDTIGNSGTGSVTLVSVGPLSITAPTTQQIVKAGSSLGIGGIVVVDPSLPSSDNVTMTLGVAHGTLTLSTSVGSGIIGSQVTGNGTGSVSITAPAAAIDATLAATSGLTYTPTSTFSGADTLSLTAGDTFNTGATGSVSLLTVGPLTITVPPTQQVLKAGGTTGVSGISVADPALPTSDNVTLTLAAGHGNLTLLTAGVTGGITSSEVANNSTGSVTITAPLAAINATLAATGGLTYAPASGFNGADTLSLTGGDTLGNSNTGSVSLLAVGPLSITAPTTTQSVKENGTLVIGGVSLADPSLPTSDIVTMTLGVTNGTATLSTSVASGLASGQMTGNGSASVTITAPLAAINATLAATGGLTYTPATNFNGASTLSLSASDGPGNSGTASVNLAVVQSISITTPSGTLSVAPNSPFVVSGISISGPTNDTVTTTFSVAHGTMTFNTAVTGGLTSAQITGNGTGSVTVTAPLTALNATLAATGGLTYTSNSGFSGPDTLSLAAGDAIGNSATGSVSLNVAAANTASLSGTVYEDANLNHVFDSTESGLAGVIVTLTGSNLQGQAVGPITLKTASNGSFDFTNLPAGTYTITKTQPADLSDGLQTVGSLSGTPQGDDVVAGISVGVGASGTGYNFSEDGLPSRLVSINMFLNSTPPYPQVLQNYITQSYSNASVSTNVPVGVASPVVAPTITVPAGAPTVNQGATLAVTGVSIADSSLSATSDNVQVTLAVTDGTLNLSTAVSGGLSSSQLSGNASGSVTITAPLSAIDATLAAANGLTYTPSTGFTGSDTLTITANDQGNNSTATAQSSSQSVQITVVGAPAITPPSTALIINQAGTLPVTGMSITDNFLLVTANTAQVTLKATNGNITLSTSVSGGITSSEVTGNASGDVVITAPLAAINATLAAINATLAATNGLTYAPNSSFSGTDTLAVTVSDLGHTASGVAQTASQNLSITVAGPMVVTAPTTAQTVATGGTLTVSGVSLADASLPTTDNVTLTLTASHGSASLSTSVTGGITGTEVTGNATGSVTITAPLAAINATLAATGGLTYTPTPSYSGADTLALSANDTLGNSNTANVSITVGG